VLTSLSCSVNESTSSGQLKHTRPLPETAVASPERARAAEAAATTATTTTPLPRHRAETPLDDADIDWDENPVMRALGKIETTMTRGEYSSITRVNEQRGLYSFDCSGMTQWVLQKAAPVAARAAAGKLARRPLAADFYRRIAAVPAGEERSGWKRIARLRDAKPGDVIAWVKPKIIDSPYTGHVAFVALPPVKVTGYSDAYLLRIIDSTSLLHDEDTRVDRTGFGRGTILLVVDLETQEPLAYGWAGLKWRGFKTDIAIGRPTR